MARRRRTVAQHARLRSPHPLAQLGKIVAVAVAVVLASSVAVATYATYDLAASFTDCLLYTSPSPRDGLLSRMPSSA